MRDGVPLKTVKFGERNPDGSAKKGITTSWNEHLAEHWLPFAKDVIDAFLKYCSTSI